MRVLVRVVAPHFTAGLVFEGKRVVEAAPILRWTMRHDADWLAAYFKRKGWEAKRVRPKGPQAGE